MTRESRRLLGIAGPPGAGKSTYAAALVDEHGPGAVCVTMDGFHLADVQLERQGLLDCKGAPETFDVHGYADLLRRLRQRPAYTVYAPAFDRVVEQPVAGAIGIGPEVELIVTEGNYLLLDEPGWREVRAQLDEVWYVETDDDVRIARLVARHVEFGKSPGAGRAWVERVDQPNARMVEASRGRADRVVRLGP